MTSDDDDSPEKCRERRRRRIEMRRMASVVPSSFPTENVNGNGNGRENVYFYGENGIKGAGTENSVEVQSSPTGGENNSSFPVPVFGSMSVSGRSREMEDAISVRTNFCSTEINRRQPLHFFGVFDGHGGSHVAMLCRERMHVYLEEELKRVKATDKTSSGNSHDRKEVSEEGDEAWKEEWERVMHRSFSRVDEAATNTCACGSVGHNCGCHPVVVALAGSTAVIAVLTADHIIVANCGDSRAVLCRGGKAIPLSDDHKFVYCKFVKLKSWVCQMVFLLLQPDREDELERIKGLGGRVIHLNGARVEGILAMSRAIGDKYLKPYVTAEPEVSFTKRDPEDQCLIIASDGLWDVLSNDLACEVASRCLQDGNHTNVQRNQSAESQRDDQLGALYPSRSASAAALLTRLALARKSEDNISVIVVDLRRN
ncbi:PPM-type phosphatase-like domain [Dillenia turbinata]|uniref:protein-serine/threonine phosphatase n=1 Tax=Dillenia turbinata TaxID=194707 RepID=A0AAN8VY65_9MAGN